MLGVYILFICERSQCYDTLALRERRKKLTGLRDTWSARCFAVVGCGSVLFELLSLGCLDGSRCSSAGIYLVDDGVVRIGWMSCLYDSDRALMFTCIYEYLSLVSGWSRAGLGQRWGSIVYFCSEEPRSYDRCIYIIDAILLFPTLPLFLPSYLGVGCADALLGISDIESRPFALDF